MDSHAILQLVYEIEGASDPAHPQETLVERMAKIFEKAGQIMRGTGFRPDYVSDEEEE